MLTVQIPHVLVNMDVNDHMNDVPFSSIIAILCHLGTILSWIRCAPLRFNILSKGMSVVSGCILTNSD